MRKMGEVWPVVTVGHHAACCLGFNTDHPQLLVSGGRTCRDKCLRDTWKYDLRNKQWEKVSIYYCTNYNCMMVTDSLSSCTD